MTNPRVLPVLGLLLAAGATLVVGTRILLASSGGEGVPIDLSSTSRALLGWYLDFRRADLESPVATTAPAMPFEISRGESVRNIGQRLHEQGLIRDPGLFVMLARYEEVDSAIVAGEYLLSPSMSAIEILDILHSGEVVEIPVTIPEGWRMEQVADRLADDGVVSAAEFIEVARSGRFDFPFLEGRPPGATLEGFLFPDTYRFSPGMDSATAIQRILENFQHKVEPQVGGVALTDGIGIFEVITLASLVERESVLAEERPLIASVYLNRLREGMPLEADSTVQYALALDRGRWWPAITVEELREISSPYNTYLHVGLPPGPIASPGLASIRAVLEPADTPYLYYYAKGDGSHAFAGTFEEHLANQARYGSGS